ncbi:MAG: T9SS type A sorting domain-containing protein [Ignavibacteriaceae bacterium]|jgi:hypothetical protein|nr:T9SS type A sorting domain-containing protein [Ignavibacteriaceae bacterium]
MTGWEKIGFVNGHGNSNSPKEYYFEDKNIQSGNYAYRLKQIDNDGRYEYSKIIEVGSGVPKEFNLSQNYPNPFNPSTKIKFSIPTETKVVLGVYNALGEQVAEVVNSIIQEGYHEVVFDAGSLPSGIYFYKIHADKFVNVKKMILLK